MLSEKAVFVGIEDYQGMYAQNAPINLLTTGPTTPTNTTVPAIDIEAPLQQLSPGRPAGRLGRGG